MHLSPGRSCEGEHPNTPCQCSALRFPMDLKSLMSLAAASRSTGGNTSSTLMTNNSNPMNAMMGQGFTGLRGGLGSNAAPQNNPFKALDILKNIQIGSSSIINPQTTTMGLIGGSGTSSTASADFVIVTVIPYTGKSTNLTG